MNIRAVNDIDLKKKKMNINDISEGKNLEMSFFCCIFADEFKKRGFFTKLGFKNYTYPILLLFRCYVPIC